METAEQKYFGGIPEAEMIMYNCGSQQCAPGYHFGPTIRDHYIIHYVLAGKGSLQLEGITYRLAARQGFLIVPGTIAYYEADNDDPWEYGWVSFNGTSADRYLADAGLSQRNPVFTYDKDDALGGLLSQASAAYRSISVGKDAHLLGLLYQFLARLIDNGSEGRMHDKSVNRKEQYVKNAVEYIAMNYSHKITVADVARHIGLDRSYLGTLFKENLQVGIQQFLILYRMRIANSLMSNRNLSLGDIARSVGYDDPLLFSKMFRKTIGTSPREHRRLIEAQTTAK